MLSFLFKPKWQHRDENIRAAAVATLRDAELSKALPRLAREDASEKVRWAALERLGDRQLLLHAALEDQAQDLRQQARRKLFKDLLADTEGSSFLPLLAKLDDESQLERVAVEARSLKLRRAALERIDRPGWLADRALSESDADTRAWLAGRLQPGPSLERLLDAARTRDKRVYKIAKEKLEAAQRSAGSPAVAEKEALQLCRKLESLLKDLPAGALEQAAAHEKAWAALGEHAPTGLAARFFGTLETLRRAVAAAAAPRVPMQTTPLQSEVEAVPATTTAAPVSTPPDLADEQLLALVQSAESAHADEDSIDRLRTRWAKRWSEVHSGHENHRLKAAFDAQLLRLKDMFNAALRERQEQHDRFRHLLDHLGQALDGGDVKAARSHEAEITQLLKAHRELDHGSDGKRWGSLKIRLQKLGDWQRWSGHNARQELCNEAEQLPALALHPDAVAAKIKDLQQRWARLDQIEGLDEAAAKALGIGRRFRALCHQAIKPARQFFEKRAEVRQRHTADFQTQLDEVETLLAATPVDAQAIITRKRELTDAFRELDRTDPTRRGEIAKRMKALLERMSQAIDARYAEVRAEKEKLIAQLRLKTRHAPREEAIELIKSTQQRFKAAGRGQRATDQALWDELKAVADPFFAAQKAEREQLDEAGRQRQAELQGTIDEVQALVAEAQAHPGATQLALTALEARWRSFDQRREDAEEGREREDFRGGGGRDARRPEARGRIERRTPEPGSNAPSREQDRAFQKAVTEVQQALAGAAQARQRARHGALVARLAQLARLEGSKAAIDTEAERAAWAAQALPEAELLPLLDARFERILAGESTDPATQASHQSAAERIALQLEYIDGRPSPDAFQNERKALQMQRLAARLGGTEKAAERERAELLAQYLAIGPFAAEARAQTDARVLGTG